MNMSPRYEKEAKTVMTSQAPSHSIYNSVVIFTKICFTFYAYPRFLVFFFSNRMFSALNSICHGTPFFISVHDNGSLYIAKANWATLLIDIYCASLHFSGLAALMSADIAGILRSLLICSCLKSYCTFLLFTLLIFFSNQTFP